MSRRKGLRLLETFPTDERLAFSLRFFNQVELAEVAAAMSVSRSTKRRLEAARGRFLERASTDPPLAEWAKEFDP